MKKWIVSSVLAASLVIGGCSLVPVAQQDKIDSLTKIVLSLQEDYVKLDGSIRAVVTQMMTGEIPVEQGAELLKTLQEEQASIGGKIQAAQKDITALSESGTSPWAIVGSVLLNLALGYVGMKYKGAAQVAATVASTVIKGVEQSGIDEVKESVARVAKIRGVSPVVDSYVQDVVRKIETAKE